MYTVDNLQKMERDFMDNEVKEILMQLVESQKQMSVEFNKRFDKIESDIVEMKSDIDEIKSDIEEIKENSEITRHASNRSGEFLEKFSNFLEPYNIGIKY